MKWWAALPETTRDVLISLFGFALGGLRRLSGLYPMTGHSADAVLWQRFGVLGLLRAGASGFVLESTSGAALVDSVRAVAAGDGVLAPEVTRAQPGAAVSGAKLPSASGR